MQCIKFKCLIKMAKMNYKGFQVEKSERQIGNEHYGDEIFDFISFMILFPLEGLSFDLRLIELDKDGKGELEKMNFIICGLGLIGCFYYIPAPIVHYPQNSTNVVKPHFH